ncbi:ATP-grasp domain-containing protein [Streptomyces sp. 5-8]|uniref:ATP-grasp domain-containing protein n=1 Tax=Streptomyces musisoli TaxID=2802280 RepID=A0ABS1PDL9_9ACTN|nr:ATP-grasp domain-containing protein [Streptomyces musisoli]MBL1110480.1 ATP-grasp domain-containing protein [Streptomyces musisoli]
MSSSSRGVLAVVETQLSNFGLTPLRAAHELGFHTVLLSNEPDRYRVVSVAEEIFAKHVDDIIETDTNSVDAVVAALEPFHTEGRLSGVMTVTDYNLPIVAEVAARFGLPGLSPQAARNCRDKLLMRRACQAAGVAVPGFHQATSEDDALAAADRFGYPCVVKPMTESASIGVTLCPTPADVLAAYRDISSRPTDFRGQPRRPGALVEEYLVGYEVSVESVLVDGERRVLGVTDKALGSHPSFVEMGDTFPSMLSAPVREQCTELAVRALEAVGHDFGAAHVEVKVTADGPRIVEVNGRMPGAEITQLIREATGVYLQRECVKLHTGQTADLTFTHSRAAASRYLAAHRAGTLDRIDGVDLARRIPGVIEVDLEAHPGDQVRPAASNLDLLGYVVAVGDTTGDAVRRAESALGQLTPLFAAGESSDD